MITSNSNPAYDLSALVISLLKGVIYQENNGELWNSLLNLHNRVRDYVAILGLELILDEAEGYAFLRSRPESSNHPTANKQLHLIARRPLSFPVSLLLALLRKKLAEFDTVGNDTRLILSQDDIVELIKLFLPAGTNETKIIDQIEHHINKIIDLGFLQRLKIPNDAMPLFEVRRIIKAFVDAQWLADFDQKLAAYQLQLGIKTKGSSDD